jgi:hypothetical protein
MTEHRAFTPQGLLRGEQSGGIDEAFLGRSGASRYPANE